MPRLTSLFFRSFVLAVYVHFLTFLLRVGSDAPHSSRAYAVHESDDIHENDGLLVSFCFLASFCIDFCVYVSLQETFSFFFFFV